jgi:putative flippase GtrA
MGRTFRPHFVTWFTSWLRAHEFLRFLIVGAVNTLVTYLIYVALLFVMTYPVAYTVTYAVGILISYCLNAQLVFKQKLRLSVALLYPIVYLLQYLLGLALLFVLVEMAHLSAFIAPLCTIFVTVPVTYFASRYVIVRGSARS